MVKEVSKIKNCKYRFKLTHESSTGKFCILCNVVVDSYNISTRKFIIMVEIDDNDNNSIGCVMAVYENHMIKFLATESITNGRENDFLSIGSEQLTHDIIDMIENDIIYNKDLNKLF